MQAHGYDGFITAEVSFMVQAREDYDPLAAATLSYRDFIKRLYGGRHRTRIAMGTPERPFINDRSATLGCDGLQWRLGKDPELWIASRVKVCNLPIASRHRRSVFRRD